jgi:uncharacterized protein YgiM (DUF1202 family)
MNTKPITNLPQKTNLRTYTYTYPQELNRREVSAPIIYAYVRPQELNLRRGPSRTYSLITTLKQNSRVQVINNIGDWWRVRFNNYEGYVYSEYLSNVPVSVYAYVRPASGLNLRNGPSTTYSSIMVLRQNTKIQVINNTGDWWRIRFGNYEGYVYSEYLSSSPIYVPIQRPKTTTSTGRSTDRSTPPTSGGRPAIKLDLAEPENDYWLP